MPGKPVFTLEQAGKLAATHFGLGAPVATQLPSYDDQNFKVRTNFAHRRQRWAPSCQPASQPAAAPAAARCERR
jgi:hypothetical protein